MTSMTKSVQPTRLHAGVCMSVIDRLCMTMSISMLMSIILLLLIVICILNMTMNMYGYIIHLLILLKR